jgi:hypothetical protein
MARLRKQGVATVKHALHPPLEGEGRSAKPIGVG